MPRLWLDTETYSELDLRRTGAYPYAQHPSTRLLLVSWAVEDGPVQVAECVTDELLSTLNDPGVEVWAHNSNFDRLILRYVCGIEVPIERWRDTSVQALLHALPHALEDLCAVLGMPTDKAKDARGKRLMQFFCKPYRGRRLTAADRPQEWAEFVQYSRQDIVAMREAHARMPRWNYPGHNGDGLAQWHLDQRINDRGVAIDMQLVRAAIEMVRREQRDLRRRVDEHTNGELTAATQRDALLQYLSEVYGVTLPDLSKAVVERALEGDLPDGARELLEIRQNASKSSSAKYEAFERATCPDGRLRGTLQFAGASRTARWAGRLVQLQNLPRPGMKAADLEAAIEAVRAGAGDLVVSNPMSLARDATRGCIVAQEGRKLIAADLANIEGRVLALLAGEEWKLEAFREFDKGEGPDLYKVAYGRSFGIRPDKVDDGDQRQIGKVMELALGYQGGVGAFVTMAATYKMDLGKLTESVRRSAPPEAWEDSISFYEWALARGAVNDLPMDVFVACNVLKTLWRGAHPAVVKLWADLEEAFRRAAGGYDGVIEVGPHLKVARKGSWVLVRLPSGRVLCYPQAGIEDGKLTCMGVNSLSRKWEKLVVYAGLLAENCTQGVARDILANGMTLAEAGGYPVVLSIHDELLAETPADPSFSAGGLSRIMATVPQWAAGLPLSAKGFEASRYRKG